MSVEWRSSGNCHVFGDDLMHDNGMMEWKHIIERQTDPAILIPRLFAAMDPGFARRVQPGDFVIAGRRFGLGKAHATAYIAMAALGLRVLCESSFEKVMRAAANSGVPIMAQCSGITSWLHTGEEITVDMASGLVIHAASGRSERYPVLRPVFRQAIEMGGRRGLLQQWLSAHPELKLPRTAPT
jgi:3-isopropylmalate/(R)-2-methylmalate dehydratase small subunit